MKPEIWKKNILEVVSYIADKNYQEKTWFGNSKEAVSSPEELYCTLFDDFIYEDFLNSATIELSSKQRELGWMLAQQMDLYQNNNPEKIDPKEIFNDPSWDEVRKSAQKFLESF